ncbi:hypothetical protein QBC43DRAFT_332988 [Cladorrhinum sp. PSN259]|nr:hypothetical protein QBC43DRAFT_332988 [Cladorrhinum sp. PSN259]
MKADHGDDRHKRECILRFDLISRSASYSKGQSPTVRPPLRVFGNVVGRSLQRFSQPMSLPVTPKSGFQARGLSREVGLAGCSNGIHDAIGVDESPTVLGEQSRPLVLSFEGRLPLSRPPIKVPWRAAAKCGEVNKPALSSWEKSIWCGVVHLSGALRVMTVQRSGVFLAQGQSRPPCSILVHHGAMAVDPLRLTDETERSAPVEKKRTVLEVGGESFSVAGHLQQATTRGKDSSEHAVGEGPASDPGQPAKTGPALPNLAGGLALMSSVVNKDEAGPRMERWRRFDPDFSKTIKPQNVPV